GSATPPRVIADAAGKLLVVIVKVPATPTVNVVLFALVKVPASLIVSVKLCVAAAPTPLVAVNVNVCVPPVPVAAVPPSVAVPFPLSGKNRPAGSALDESAGVGLPAVVTVNEPAMPVVKVALLALVIDAGACTINVKFWTTGVPPFVAVNLSR